MRIAEPLGQSVFKDPLDIIQGKDDELSRRLMKLNEREKRYHNDVFTDIRRDEAFMKSYNEKLVAAYQDLSKVQGKPIGKSTEEMLEFLGTKERENFVIPPAVLDPLVRAYEAKHEFFENEVITLQGDLKRMAATVELLLNDNNKLRSHLTKRDTETSQLLETIGLNDGETVLKLRKQITVLEDELRLLYQQLDQQKELRGKTNLSYERLERENEELRRVMQKMKVDLEETKLKSQQSAEHRVVVNQSLAELQKKLDIETAEKARLEGESRKQKDQIARLEQSRKEWERKIEMRDSDSRKNEEMRMQEVALLTNTVNNLKSELYSREREYSRLDQMVKSKSLTDGELSSQVESIKAKNNFLMGENKDLKKRIREVMQIETDYQDTTVALKKRVADLERLLQRQSGLGSQGQPLDDTTRGLLEKRYDDMKRHYESRTRDLERELQDYKDMNNQLMSRAH